MTEAIKTRRSLALGEVLSADAGRYIVRVQRVRPDALVVTVEHAATGLQVDELRRSFVDETDARNLARTVTTCLRLP